MSLGELLTEIRISRKLTRTELADALKVDRSVVRRWENDQYTPSLTLFFQLIATLELTPKETGAVAFAAMAGRRTGVSA